MSILKIEEDENSCVVSLRRFCKFHESMTTQTASLCAKYYAEEARYQAPFFDIQGRKKIAEFWLNRRVLFADYKLKIRHTSWDDNGQTAFIYWDFIGTRKGRRITISGASEILFNLKGLILAQNDHYDPLRAFMFEWPFWGGFFKGRMRR